MRTGLTAVGGGCAAAVLQGMIAVTKRRRNQLCLGLILLSLANVFAYVVAYSYIGGDAWNGGRGERGEYYVRGHFVHSAEGQQTQVSRAVWVYSYLHSTTFWPSLATVILAMLVLARPHIIATCRDGPIRGASLVAAIAAAVVLVTVAGTAMVLMDFLRALR